MRRHATDRAEFPGGGELARHLLDFAGLDDVRVELSGHGDHYDPVDKAVRLTLANHDRRLVTAVAVAAHEVSHALQDADRNRLPAQALRENEDVKEFYLGMAEGNRKSFRQVKSYKRRKRWLA